MKFAIITDNHFGPKNAGYLLSARPDAPWKNSVQRKLCYKAKELTSDFVMTMNQRNDIDFVINLGDLIEDVNDREVDTVNYKKILAEFALLNVPIHYLIGNHDVRTLVNKDIKEMLNVEQLHHSFDSSGYHFICLDFE